ncbi:MAG TPA: hypothetical protein VK730_10625 [Solirubrobacteraceae bacterium]|jgi:hypothetical protein|nr:hypothetical protein [Solirubrobacteraceae bacterium]
MSNEIRSYRCVFDLERRLYRIDRLRLNPAGVPLRGIVYFLALLGTVLLAGALPLVGALVRMLPWYLREVGAPGACAALLTLIKVEGRPFHLAALALVRYGVGPRELSGLRPRRSADRRWRLDELVVLADGSDSRLRRLRYTGQGAVLVSTAHVLSSWHRGLVRGLMRRPDMRLVALPAKPRPAKGQVIALTDGARLEVRT